MRGMVVLFLYSGKDRYFTLKFFHFKGVECPKQPHHIVTPSGIFIEQPTLDIFEICNRLTSGIT